MKPNTNVPGCTLVIPPVDVCPMCGFLWASVVDDGKRFDTEGARPCVIVGDNPGACFDSDATIETYESLRWTCNRCGYFLDHVDAPDAEKGAKE